MAGILTVQTIQGPTSGANANKVIIPAGQTLDASAGGVTLPAGVGGKILQVVTHTFTDASNISSSSFTDATNSSVSITPTSSSSKILVIANLQLGNGGNVQNSDGEFRIVREGTTEVIKAVHRTYDYGGSAVYIHVSHGLNALDSPNTTSTIGYKVQIRVINTAAFALNDEPSSTSSITLMEIAQ
jgi:hypothetical protein